MVKNLTIELLRDIWLMHQPSVETYAIAAQQYLSGKEVSTGFFSSLKLPDVPENIALIPVVGALTKSDVCGWKGTRSMTLDVQAAASDKKKDAIILLYENCPGGQVNGTEEFGDAIKAAKKVKPVVSAISDMCCSAGVWTMAQSNESFATSSTAMIGCIGVMGRIKNPNKPDGEASDFIEVISDFSPDKNKEYSDADLYKKGVINPMALLFREAVMSGRGDRLKLSKEDVLTGKTYIAPDAVKYGLIDGIKPFNKIVARTIQLAKSI